MFSVCIRTRNTETRSNSVCIYVKFILYVFSKHSTTHSENKLKMSSDTNDTDTCESHKTYLPYVVLKVIENISWNKLLIYSGCPSL